VQPFRVANIGRIARLARTGQVLVLRTVVDLVAGSGLYFNDRGAYRLADGLGRVGTCSARHRMS
jgi:hypothetical protein